MFLPNLTLYSVQSDDEEQTAPEIQETAPEEVVEESPKEKEPEIKRVYTEEEAQEVERVSFQAIQISKLSWSTFSSDMYCSFIFQDSEFLAFFDRTSRVMERFLSEPHNDYFADYTGESGKFFSNYSQLIFH